MHAPLLHQRWDPLDYRRTLLADPLRRRQCRRRFGRCRHRRSPQAWRRGAPAAIAPPRTHPMQQRVHQKQYLQQEVPLVHAMCAVAPTPSGRPAACSKLCSPKRALRSLLESPKWSLLQEKRLKLRQLFVAATSLGALHETVASHRVPFAQGRRHCSHHERATPAWIIHLTLETGG